MIPPIDACHWPLARAGEALEALALAAGLPGSPGTAGAFGSSGANGSAAANDLEALAQSMGLEAERLVLANADLVATLRHAGPTLLRAGPAAAPWIVAILETGRARARVIAPDHAIRTVPLDALHDALLRDTEEVHAPRVDAIVRRLPLAPARQGAVRAALLREQIKALPRDLGWSLRLSPSAPFLAQLRRAGIARALRAMTAAHAGSFAVSLVAWWVIGRGALTGHLDRGRLCAWALLVAMLIPIRVLTTWQQGLASIGVGMLLKQRMLLGALKLDPDTIRHQGMGHLLGRILEVDAVEDLGFHGGLVSVVALIELAITVPVLAMGPSGLASVLLFFAWLALAGVLLGRFAVRWLAWSRARHTMTNDLVEGMLGHRTRIAQEPPADWHQGEDRALAAHLEHLRGLDRLGAWITGWLPRGWLVVGMASLMPALGSTAGVLPEKLAVGLGGVLLARAALMRLASGLTSLTGALSAWQHARPLFHAAARPEPGDGREAERGPAAADIVLDARNLVFRYRPGAPPVLRDVTFRIHARDRVLLEGPSGEGKSTLGSLLAGLRAPESGLLLLDGLDRTTRGARGWRRHIAAAPQFHENHVLSNTFAFNLLMGRDWPPRKEDLALADTLCRELGLGPLLDRMPGGLMQRVGETGWQLSHGERSRLYMARALLQRADLLILDESFASLDPETLARALRCVLDRAPALVVMAHP
ncbi:ATP-binding cassette domain-containing protein [Pendulispora albinea]|uniref:ABC transporter ATP-binding protein/permease n=1 Tax=Pendulispora albinea TaxID=2741071 RepID=A0ABZ2MC17_9BACT